MATLQELRNERVEKLTKLRELGVNPYPATSDRKQTIQSVLNDFSEDESTTVVGRIWAQRGHGKLRFFDIRDDSGEVQLLVRADQLEKLDEANSQLGFEQLNLLDIGDFIEVGGTTTTTRTGQPSMEVSSLRILSKSLRPLPDSWSGLKDKETRMRRRYLDTNLNDDVKQRYLRRSQFWQSTRQFLIDNGFVEINIPVLESTAGGADANPFVTHMDALGQDFYLRISHELPLKRLLVGGYEKVFDIGPRFRNENYSDEHLPEHVAMEWYWAYADWKQGMKLTQQLVRHVADNTWGGRTFSLDGVNIDLGGDDEDWPQLSFVNLIKENYDIDVFDTSIDEVAAKLKEYNLEVEKTDSIGRGIDKLWKKLRVDIPGPAFLVDVPAFLQPLAKVQKGDGRLSQQFNLLLGGTEACKAYGELNDPQLQLDRFVEQQQLRDEGDNEAMMLDIEYVEALEYGMPPACGFGYSERLFWLLEGVTAREGVPFPQLRSEISDTTKDIYSAEFESLNGS